MVFFYSRALLFYKEQEVVSVHQALYRKWRPKTFDEVCGQDHITSILKYETQTGQFSHAYLFCGSRGTGKTTCAKILAKAVNCEFPVNGSPCGKCAACMAIDAGSATDVLEMDAASNNGVDDIRDIRDEVVYAPSDLKYRVYIIDEVHMLSTSAFNALLKTLEEPPAHVVFVLATTELQKLPATIVSRCQRFDFRRIATDVLTDRLLYIAGQEGMNVTQGAARLLARQAQGGMRDAISLLELCGGSRQDITEELVADTIGSVGREAMAAVVEALAERRYDDLFEAVDRTVRSSKDLIVFWQELISFYRDMIVIRTTKQAATYLDLTDTEEATMRALADRFSKETLLYHTGLLDDALFAMQKANAVKRTVAELTLVRMCDPAMDTSTEAILARLSRLEEQAVTGGFAASPAVTKPSETPKKEKKTAPTPSPEPDVAQPAAPKPVAQPPQPKQTITSLSEGRTLRGIRGWSEVVERIRSSDPMSASFLGQAKAYTTGEQGIVIRFQSEFERDMAKSSCEKSLVAALSVTLQRPVAQGDILYEVASAASVGNTGIDTIIEAIEET